MAVKPVNPKSWTSWIRASDGYLRSDDPYGTYGSAPRISALPSISTSAPQFLTAAQISALDVANMAQGTRFIEPISGVTITKVTGASYPVTNSNCFFDYVEGGPWVSGEWGSGWHTIYFKVAIPSGVGYFVDYNRVTGQITNARNFDAGITQRWCWSSNPATPRIGYYVTNATPGVLNRYDTSTNALANTGFFPHTFTGSAGPLWLQTDRTDTTFVCMDNPNTTDTVRTWNSSTNVALNRVFVGMDEPHFERDGRYVAVIVAPFAYCWDLTVDTVSSIGNTFQFYHVCHLRNGWISPYSNGLSSVDNYFTPKAAGVAFNRQAALAGYPATPSVHWSGHWVQSVNTDQQYGVAFTAGHGNAGGYGEAHANHDGTINCEYNLFLGHGSIIYRRADGGDNRYLCCNFTTYLTGSDNGAIMGGLSPDGKVCVFSSNMGVPSGSPGWRVDVFAVNVPT